MTAQTERLDRYRHMTENDHVEKAYALLADGGRTRDEEILSATKAVAHLLLADRLRR